MDTFRADLHLHTHLSPCGDLEMTPRRLVAAAREHGIGILGITDHNTTRQGREMRRRLGPDPEPYLLCGAEVTTAEEVHCLVFADTDEALDRLEAFLQDHLPRIPNDPELFGYQVLADWDEQVLELVPDFLPAALDTGLESLTAFVRSLGGLIIPAHIDKGTNSLFSQLGFLPPGLDADAYEISARCDPAALLQRHPDLQRLAPTLIRSSDAHYPEEPGRVHTLFRIERPSFEEIRMALHGKDGRNASPGPSLAPAFHPTDPIL